jgi:hypothetical protein
MFHEFATALLMTAVFAQPARAQVRIAAIGHPAASGYGISAGPVRSAGFRARSGMQRAQHAPLLLGSPYFYSDDFSTAVEPPAAPAPQVVVLQAQPASEAAKEPKPEALLIEWQGDRYVRIGASERTTRGVPASMDYAEAKPPARPTGKAAAPASPPAPVVLVYRDGRREEVRDYTIADGALYARGDYWVDGYWSRKIQLIALDLPATMNASLEHGGVFVLPSSPNEVIVRP